MSSLSQFLRRRPGIALLLVLLSIGILYGAARLLTRPDPAAPKEVASKRERVSSERERQAQRYYDLGRKLAREKKYAAALKAFEKAATYDSDFKDVSAWVASKGKSGDPAGASGSPGSGDPSPGGGDSNPPEEIVDPPLQDVIPVSIPEYSAGVLAKDKTSVECDFTRNDQREIGKLVIRAYKMGSPADASRFLGRVSRKLYSSNAKNVAFRGTTAYFGTQEPLLATFAWARGTVVRELVMESTKRTPKDLYAHLVAAAQYVK